MKRKLFLITDFFPYGTSESFVMTELCYLNQWYDITVVPRYKAVGEPRALPADVKVQTIARHLTMWEKIRFSCGFVFSRRGRREWLSILRSGEKYLARFKASLKDYVSSELIWTELLENGITAQSEGTVYYSFWYTASAIALSAHRAELPGSRVVVRTHGYDLYNERCDSGRQPFKPAADEGMDRIVSCCRVGKDYYRKTFLRDDSPKHIMIPLGSEHGGVPVRQKSDALRLVSCSMAVPLKRIERIIEGLSILSDVPVEWTHIGDGKQMSFLRSMAEEKLAGKENIRWCFTGNLPNAEVHERYKAGRWDAFITTSTSEGSPISIQEALSYGLPVIATAVGGIPELLENSDNILLPSEPTAQEVAAAIARIHDMKPDAYAALQTANYRRWESEYCAANNARRMMEMMEELWQHE